MFTFLDAVNQYLGYINFSPKLKNRIYTLVGGIGTGYLFYAGLRFLFNGLWLQGGAFIAVALVLLYFLFLNVVYYFTERRAPLDISPRVERILGIKPRQALPGISGEPVIDDLQNPRNIPLDGFYDPKHVLPAKLISNQTELQNIATIAHDMLTNSLLTDNYAGLSERELTQYLSRSRKPAFAICAGALIPHFNLQLINGQYVAYAGINQAHLLRVGVVERIGLQAAHSINPARVQLFAAAAILVGGNFKMDGRSGIVDQQQPYRIQMRIAFKKPQKA